MNQYQSWTINKCHYDCPGNECKAKNLTDFVDQIQDVGYKYQIPVNPSLPYEVDSYIPFIDYMKDSFINQRISRDNDDTVIYTGKSWSVDPELIDEEKDPYYGCNADPLEPDFKSKVAYLDLLGEKGQSDYAFLLQKFREMINYSGVINTFTEPTNLQSLPTYDKALCNEDLVGLPYIPRLFNGKLSANTICMDAKHNIKEPNYHYHSHNDMVIATSLVTYQALTEGSDERPFLMARSTATGSGIVNSHWAGEVNSTDWEQLRISIVNANDMSIFGVAHTGSSACGSIFNPKENPSTKELCSRWTQMSSYLPVSRNFDADLILDSNKIVTQYPASFDAEFQRNVKPSIMERYQLLPFWYDLFYKQISSGDSVLRPLFENYPEDIEAYGIDDQYREEDQIFCTCCKTCCFMVILP